MTTDSVFGNDLTASLGMPDRFPRTKAESDKVEAVLARELAKISLQEQEKILLDMYGVRVTAPTPGTIATLLHQMETEIALIREKHAYERAQQLDREYVQNQDFRMLFLRAEGFDPKAAAKRVVLHFEVKQELFVRKQRPQLGNHNDAILVRDITWDDLDEVDQRCVLLGGIQVSPQRDIAGRTILFVIPTLLRAQSDMLTVEAVSRAIWYTIMSALASDRDVQELGVVQVVFNLDGETAPWNIAKKPMCTRKSLPIYTAACHYCYRHASLHPVMAGFRLLVFTSKTMRCRFRVHFGKLETVVFNLNTFGIPTESIPLEKKEPGRAVGTDFPNLCLKWHLEWLDSLRVMELRNQRMSCHQPPQELDSYRGGKPLDSSAVWSRTTEDDTSKKSAGEETIIIPRRFDVLFGKTKDAMKHTGTVRCQHIVRMHQEAYEKATRSEKTEIATRILTIIHESHGRFLKSERKVGGAGCYWVPVKDAVAREKISHFFRQLRSEQLSATNSSTNKNLPTVSTTGGKPATKRPLVQAVSTS